MLQNDPCASDGSKEVSLAIVCSKCPWLMVYLTIHIHAQKPELDGRGEIVNSLSFSAQVRDISVLLR